GNSTTDPGGITNRWGENCLFFCVRVECRGDCFNAAACDGFTGVKETTTPDAFSCLSAAICILPTTSAASRRLAAPIASAITSEREKPIKRRIRIKITTLLPCQCSRSKRSLARSWRKRCDGTPRRGAGLSVDG